MTMRFLFYAILTIPSINLPQNQTTLVGYLMKNAYMHLSDLNESNFVYHKNDSKFVICTMMKIGSSTLSQMGFQKMTKQEAAEKLVDPTVLRGVLVRDPVERFVSWYRDKILNGDSSRIKSYNKILLQTSSSTKYSIEHYAQKILERKSKAWDLEYHLSPMTRMCHINILQYDIVEDIRNISSFFKRIETISNLKFSNEIPHSNYNYKHVNTFVLEKKTKYIIQQIYDADQKSLHKLSVETDNCEK